MNRSRPESVDPHGVRHRHGCQAPGWTSGGPTAGIAHVLRCAGCGAVRLVPAGTRPKENRP